MAMRASDDQEPGGRAEAQGRQKAPLASEAEPAGQHEDHVAGDADEHRAHEVGGLALIAAAG
jgi:hypothetical protein